jgi:hypothetical protein
MTDNYRDDPILGPALAYWIQKRGNRPMPSRRDIDPTEIPRKILPNLQLIDVVDGGARFRYRLVGTATVEAYGQDFTGKHPDEMFPPELRDFIHDTFRTVCRSKAPLYVRNGYITAKDLRLLSARIYMPLSDNNADVTHIFAALRFEYSSSPGAKAWTEGAELDLSASHIEPVDIAPMINDGAP